MEATDPDHIVIVGAGIAGLTTALGLHRLGIRSLVLESSDQLRTTGFALSIWPNAWKALDALSIGDSLRRDHRSLLGYLALPTLILLPLLVFWNLELWNSGTNDLPGPVIAQA
ncbi:hypothetical protein CRG98_027157 [Punica granatum]|uniref:FAD dependent oxidoreductase domain-containing protein n=1 Tax=Punica granatum TaxID=22663 RepID=A0A2I0J8A7_PUNGR|nr:hypothetical protein CRG98_027157 [Punica granatum]